MATSNPRVRAHKVSNHKALSVIRHKFKYAPRKAFTCSFPFHPHEVPKTTPRATVGGVTYCRIHSRSVPIWTAGEKSARD